MVYSKKLQPKKLRSYNQAFGLIEVIVSTSIILIVAGAALGLGRLALKNSVISYERTQAYNLAREAMETIRNQRDYLWSGEVNRPAAMGTYLYETAIPSLDLNGEIKLPNNNTAFTRLVEATPLSPNTITVINDIILASGGSGNVPITAEFGSEIKVKVTWDSYGKERNVTLTTTLTDWKPADVGWGVEY